MIAVFGSVNVDHVIEVDHLPRPGETIISKSYQKLIGGKGANQAVAASRCGAEVALFATLGDDRWGRYAIASLADEGILVEDVSVKKGCETGAAYIYVDGEGENQIVVVPGSNQFARLGVIPDTAKVLVMQMEIPAPEIVRAAALAKAQNLKVVLNTAPVTGVSGPLLDQVDVVIGNELEILGAAEMSIYDALEAASKYGAGHDLSVVVTLGKRGALFVNESDRFWAQAAPIDVVDTVGAGDGFVGSFATGFQAGLGFRRCVTDAVSFGSAMCTVAGAQTAPDRDVVARLAQSTFVTTLN